MHSFIWKDLISWMPLEPAYLSAIQKPVHVNSSHGCSILSSIWRSKGKTYQEWTRNTVRCWMRSDRIVIKLNQVTRWTCFFQPLCYVNKAAVRRGRQNWTFLYVVNLFSISVAPQHHDRGWSWSDFPWNITGIGRHTVAGDVCRYP